MKRTLMMFPVVFLQWIISVNALAIDLNKDMTLCTKKNKDEFIARINTLDSIHEIDSSYEYPLEKFSFIKIRALDMIKSQSKEKDGQLFWLLEFRPLPDQTDLAAVFYPRILLNCERSVNTFKCHADQDKKDTMRVFKDFSFILTHQNSNECTDGYSLGVKYTLSIDDAQFQSLKEEALKQIVGSNNSVLEKVVDQLFVPSTLFESYILHLYKMW